MSNKKPAVAMMRGFSFVCAYALFAAYVANLKSVNALERADCWSFRAPDRGWPKMILDAHDGRWRYGSAMVGRGIDRGSPMRKTASIIAMAIYVALWVLAFLVMTTDAPLGRGLLIPLAIGAAIGGITWRMTMKISRGFRRLSFAAGFLGLIFAFLFGAPVFVDTFDPKNPPTSLAILIPNVIVSLPYAMLPATMLLLAGWVVGKVRNRN